MDRDGHLIVPWREDRGPHRDYRAEQPRLERKLPHRVSGSQWSEIGVIDLEDRSCGASPSDVRLTLG